MQKSTNRTARDYPHQHPPSKPPKPAKRKIYMSRHLVKLVVSQANYRCYYCGIQCTKDRGAGPYRATIDHKIPLSRGGTYALENLVCACRACNNKKGARSAEEFHSQK